MRKVKKDRGDSERGVEGGGKEEWGSGRAGKSESERE